MFEVSVQECAVLDKASEIKFYPLFPKPISGGDLRIKYVGMQTPINRNNRLSVLLLFPSIILGMVWIFLASANYFGIDYQVY